MQLTLERVGKTVGRMVRLYPQSVSPVPGAVTVLLGATQAGKTSLMRLMVLPWRHEVPGKLISFR